MADGNNPAREPETIRLLVAQVATAYFSASRVNPAEIPEVIARIASGLQSISEDAPATADWAEACSKPTPAQVRRSITPEALISFEDGRPYKALARHLAARGLTPDAYRDKWGLPRDYPMVAQSYSAVRSELAKRMELAGHGLKARRRGQGAGGAGGRGKAGRPGAKG